MQKLIVTSAIFAVIITAGFFLLRSIADNIPVDEADESGLSGEDSGSITAMETISEELSYGNVIYETIAPTIPNMPHVIEVPNSPAVTVTTATTEITLPADTETQTEPLATDVLVSQTTPLPLPPMPAPLSPEAEFIMRGDFAAYKADVWSGLTADDITLIGYYGSYNGGSVVILYPRDYPVTHDIQYMEVAGYTLTITSGSFELLFYKDSSFMGIGEAYALGYLTDYDIFCIDYIMNPSAYEEALPH
ncbi:MAG: hypothetical protein FWG90_08685 [Oscillospiraceae bacterium]|nr:hypothetical protein [Oscillospiraceae bacterium]